METPQPRATFNPIRDAFQAQIRLALGAHDDANSCFWLGVAFYNDTTKRLAVIMGVRVLEVHVASIAQLVDVMIPQGFSVSKGELKLLKAKGRLLDRLRLSFELAERIQPRFKAPRFDDDEWTAVKAAVEVRHRVMHPRTEAASWSPSPTSRQFAQRARCSGSGPRNRRRHRLPNRQSDTPRETSATIRSR